MWTDRVAAPLVDRSWRAAYWIGFRLAYVWWWLRRPHHQGALVAIWHDRRILAVRQSYRRHLSWPGGGVDAGEDPRAAAQRELVEELGLVVALADLRLVREIVMDLDYRHDHVHIFELHLLDRPQLMIDRREIVAADFIEPRALLAGKNISPVLRVYLEDWLRGQPAMSHDE